MATHYRQWDEAKQIWRYTVEVKKVRGECRDPGRPKVGCRRLVDGSFVQTDIISALEVPLEEIGKKKGVT